MKNFRLTDDRGPKVKQRLITCDGETHTMKEWSKISGINYATIKLRIKKGWEPHKAIFEKPQREKKPSCNLDCDNCEFIDCIAPDWLCVKMMQRENGGITPGGEPKDVQGSWMKCGTIQSCRRESYESY